MRTLDDILPGDSTIEIRFAMRLDDLNILEDYLLAEPSAEGAADDVSGAATDDCRAGQPSERRVRPALRAS